MKEWYEWLTEWEDEQEWQRAWQKSLDDGGLEDHDYGRVVELFYYETANMVALEDIYQSFKARLIREGVIG